MKTGIHKGRPTYGPRPSAAALGARAERERWAFAEARPCLHNIFGRYWIEAWARPATSAGSYLVYSLRGDGRIGRSWVAIREADLDFAVPGACEDCPEPHASAGDPCPLRRDE